MNSPVVVPKPKPGPKPGAEPEEGLDWYLSQVTGPESVRRAIARELQPVCEYVRDNGITVRNWQKYFDAALAKSEKFKPVREIKFLPDPPPFRERKNTAK